MKVNCSPLTNLQQLNILNRLPCNLFRQTQTSTRPPPTVSDSNSLERQTIESNGISTISSLVDKSKIANSQRENYGLYALKCSRNATRRAGIILNLNAGEPTGHIYEIKHEQFEPCRSTDDSELNQDSINEPDHEYYKIELNAVGGLMELTRNRDSTQRMAPVPQRRTKKVSQKKPTQRDVPREPHRAKSPLPQPTPRPRSTSPRVCSPQLGILPPSSPPRPRSPLPPFQLPKIELKKNKSSLFRTSNRKCVRNLSRDSTSSCDKSLDEFDIKPPTKSTKPTNPLIRRISASDSSFESVDIFKSPDDRAFEDFDEIFSNETIAAGRQANGTDRSRMIGGEIDARRCYGSREVGRLPEKCRVPNDRTSNGTRFPRRRIVTISEDDCSTEQVINERSGIQRHISVDNVDDDNSNNCNNNYRDSVELSCDKELHYYQQKCYVMNLVTV